MERYFKVIFFGGLAVMLMLTVVLLMIIATICGNSTMCGPGVTIKEASVFPYVAVIAFFVILCFLLSGLLKPQQFKMLLNIWPFHKSSS